MRNSWILALALSLAAGTAVQRVWGQSTTDERRVKFWITFVDKNNGPGRAPLAVEPDRLTPRARARRLQRGRPGRQMVDVPVSPYYIERLRELGIEPIVGSRWLNAVSAYLTPEQSEAVSRLGFVRSVVPVARTQLLTGSDGRFDSEKVFARDAPSEPNAPLLDYGPSLSQLQTINAVQPIEDGFIGSGVLLGFLDTTTDTLHPAFQHLVDSSRIVAVRDFTVELDTLSPQSNKHGLFTSSTAMGFDEGNLIGPCYGGEYILATTEYAPFEENREEDFFVAGMEWLESMGTDIVNVSLGYSTFDAGEDSYTYEDMDGNTAKTTIASDIAVSLGVVVVVSAGNAAACGDPNSCWYYITSPADGDSVITAGAVEPDSSVAGFSSRGPTFDGRTKPDVSAPGTSVRFASGGGGYSTGGGTSFSSPLVAGVACQILQANPSLNPIEVRALLRSTASQADNPDNNKGWGIINAAEAVRLASLQDSTAPALLGFSVDPDTADVTTADVDVDFLVRASDSLSGVREVEVCLADPSGNENCQTSAVPDSGDTGSGRWTVPITIPQLSETGTWRVSQVVVRDSVVSSVAYDSTGLDGAGFETRVEVVVQFHLSATLLLEGPYAGDGMMAVGDTHLANIPLEHPFDTSAYTGTSLFYDVSAAVDSIPIAAVDWLLVSLRSDTSADSTLASSTQAVLLMDDGSIVDTAGADPTFSVPGGLSWYVVIRTRNHGSVMTPVPIDFSSGHGSWDFTDSLGAAYTTGPDPLKMLEPGYFGLFACDIDHDGHTTVTDFGKWLVSTKSGFTGYLQEDCSLDGHATIIDFGLWLPNTKAAAGSQVP